MIVEVKRCESELGIGVTSLLNTAPGSKGVTWLLWVPTSPCHVTHLSSDDGSSPAAACFLFRRGSKRFGTGPEARGGNGWKRWAGSDPMWAPGELGWAAPHGSLRKEWAQDEPLGRQVLGSRRLKEERERGKLVFPIV